MEAAAWQLEQDDATPMILWEDPKIYSAGLEANEPAKLVGVWIDNLQAAVIGLLDDRVTFQSLVCENEQFLHKIVNSIKSAELIAIIGPDQTKEALMHLVRQDKRLAKKIVAVQDSAPTTKARLITAVQKIFETTASNHCQIYNEHSRSLLE